MYDLETTELINTFKMCYKCHRITQGPEDFRSLKENGGTVRTCLKCRNSVLKSHRKKPKKIIKVKDRNTIIKNILLKLDSEILDNLIESDDENWVFQHFTSK